MGEKVIELGGVNPIDIYGSNNKKLTFILSFFEDKSCRSRQYP